MPTTLQAIPKNIQTILKRPELYKTYPKLTYMGWSKDPLQIPLQQVLPTDTSSYRAFGIGPRTQPIIRGILGGPDKKGVDGLHQLVNFAKKENIYSKKGSGWFASTTYYTGNQVCEKWDAKENQSTICKGSEVKCCENIKNKL